MIRNNTKLEFVCIISCHDTIKENVRPVRFMEYSDVESKLSDDESSDEKVTQESVEVQDMESGDGKTKETDGCLGTIEKLQRNEFER